MSSNLNYIRNENAADNSNSNSKLKFYLFKKRQNYLFMDKYILI